MNLNEILEKYWIHIIVILLAIGLLREYGGLIFSQNIFYNMYPACKLVSELHGLPYVNGKIAYPSMRVVLPEEGRIRAIIFFYEHPSDSSRYLRLTIELSGGGQIRTHAFYLRPFGYAGVAPWRRCYDSCKKGYWWSYWHCDVGHEYYPFELNCENVCLYEESIVRDPFGNKSVRNVEFNFVKLEKRIPKVAWEELSSRKISESYLNPAYYIVIYEPTPEIILPPETTTTTLPPTTTTLPPTPPEEERFPIEYVMIPILIVVSIVVAYLRLRR